MNRILGAPLRLAVSLLLLASPFAPTAASASDGDAGGASGTLNVSNGVSYACGPSYSYRLDIPPQYQYSVSYTHLTLPTNREV